MTYRRDLEAAILRADSLEQENLVLLLENNYLKEQNNSLKHTLEHMNGTKDKLKSSNVPVKFEKNPKGFLKKLKELKGFIKDHIWAIVHILIILISVSTFVLLVLKELLARENY